MNPSSSSSSTKRQSTTITSNSSLPSIESCSVSWQHVKQPAQQHHEATKGSRCRRRLFMMVRLWMGALILASLCRHAVFLGEQHQQQNPLSSSSGRSTDVSSISAMLLTELHALPRSSSASVGNSSSNNVAIQQGVDVVLEQESRYRTTSRPTNNIMFLHVGKAGGETIKTLLKPTCYLHYHSRRGVLNCLENLYFMHNRNGNNNNIINSTNANDASGSRNATLETSQRIGAATTSRITQVVTSYMHVDTLRYPAAENATREADGYLFNLRHPLERLIS
jgi:hypothetical protein